MKKLLVALFIAVAAASAVLLAPVRMLENERHDLVQAAMQLGLTPVAATLLRPLAAAGDARALNNLGTLYARGAGVLRDFAAARRAFVAAAERGSVRGRLNLALLGNGGCGLNVRGSAQTAAELESIGDGDPAAASLIQDCLYFEATEQVLPDRDRRLLETGAQIERTGDPDALLQAGWTLLDRARTAKTPDSDKPGEQGDYDRRVLPIARKAMELLFAAAEAGATGAYHPLGILSMQFGEQLGSDPMAVRLRDKSNWEWMEEGAQRGDWEAQCRVAQASMHRLRWGNTEYTRDEFDAAVAQARACVDRKEPPQKTWYDAPEWLAALPRRVPLRPSLDIETTAAELNGLIFFDADKRLGGRRDATTRSPGILIRGQP